eukprot:5132909-Amphidinium_carterae.1
MRTNCPLYSGQGTRRVGLLSHLHDFSLQSFANIASDCHLKSEMRFEFCRGTCQRTSIDNPPFASPRNTTSQLT